MATNVVVKPGDTLSAIGARYGVPYQQISGFRSGNPNMIFPGENLSVPSAQNFSQAPANFSSARVQAAKNFTPSTPLAMRPISSPMFVSGTPDWVKSIIEKAANDNNIPTMILSALLKQESGFNPNVTSPVGAQGIAQFMPDTASSYGIDPNDPNQAIPAAAKYLRSSLDHFGGDMKKAVASYNAGVGAVDQYDGVPPYEETQNYVKNIMAMASDPHASAYGPVLNTINEAKAQSQKAATNPVPTPAPSPRPAPSPQPSPTPSVNPTPNYLAGGFNYQPNILPQAPQQTPATNSTPLVSASSTPLSRLTQLNQPPAQGGSNVA